MATRKERINAAVFRALGVTVQYRPNGGQGDPIETLVIPHDPKIAQGSQAPQAYFADAEVNPIDVPSPRKGDVVQWDDTTYVVAMVSQAAKRNALVALHKKVGA